MTTRRRTLILGAIALFAPFASIAQQPRVFRLGLLVAGSPTIHTEAFISALRDLGYVEGKSVVIERRFAEGNAERMSAYAAELVKARVDAIMTVGSPATVAASKATQTIPIIFAAGSDPVGIGVITSLAKPGGNVTGSSSMAPELSAKRLELLHLLAPRTSQIAMLWDSSNPGMAQRVRETKSAADKSRVALRAVGPRNLEELEMAFAELAKQRPDALLVTVEPFTRRHLPRILDFCSSNRIPCMFEDRSFVEAGGLVSYGPDLLDIYRRAAPYVDKIFKGAKPADLPVEQPTKFELVINMKTAKALGTTIPESLLLRADKVIE